jgi:hypothetical protein
MKNNSILAALVAVLLLVLAVGVYAHGGETSDNDVSRWNMMGHMVTLQEMDEMHEAMTEGLDPELKDQMDLMHDGCTSSFKKTPSTGGMMRWAG